MSYETEWMVDVIASFEKTEDPKKIQQILKTTLNDESISLLEVYRALKKRAYSIPLNGEMTLKSLFDNKSINLKT